MNTDAELTRISRIGANRNSQIRIREIRVKVLLEIRVHPCPSVVKNSFGSGPEKRNFDLITVARRINFPSMSATEIINELPKLTEAELRLVRQRMVI